MDKLALAVEKSGSSTVDKGESETQTDHYLLIIKNSDGHPSVLFGNVSFRKEVMESESEELLSESQVKTERANLQTDLWIDSEHSEEYQNVAGYEFENVINSEDDVDVKHCYDETVSDVVDTTLIANISPNQGMSETNNVLCNPQISTKTVLLKCLKKPTIQLERIQPFISRNSPQNAAAATFEENVKCEQALDDSNCPEILSKESPFKCREISCEKSFERKCDLARHQKIHATGEKEKRYKCSFCSKSFKRSDRFEEHERIHNGEKPYKCLEISCLKSFTNKSNFITHQRIHSGEKPYTCSFCPKSFVQSIQLKLHERSHTGETPYKCGFCSKSYAQSCRLKYHERTHSGEKPFKCSFYYCDKSFASSSHLKYHERSHSGEKSYTCSFCSESFSESEDLKVHKTIHSEEKRYKCSFCSRSFGSKSHLKYHERTHSTERPYKCSICSKSFREFRVLKVHETIHSEERPYKCSSCSKSFGCTGELRMHEMIHTGYRPHKCTNCEKSFTTKQNLTNHRTRIHEKCKEEFILS